MSSARFDMGAIGEHARSPVSLRGSGIGEPRSVSLVGTAKLPSKKRRDSHVGEATALLRVSIATSTTQLLPLIHILRREPSRGVADVLLISADNMGTAAASGAELMREVARSYPFAAVHNIDHLETAKLRTAGPLGWPVQFVQRSRHDARDLRRRLAPFLRSRPSIEVWSDQAIHWPARLLHALFPGATHVKLPHAFFLEDVTQAAAQEHLARRARREATPARRALWAVNRLISGVAYDAESGLTFDRGYTFDAPSTWGARSVDVSASLNLAELTRTYDALPANLRAEVDEQVREAARGSTARWVLVVLLALDETSLGMYVRAVRRFAERFPHLAVGRRIVLKTHPTSPTPLRHTLVEELEKAGFDASLFDCRLNLDIMWHRLPVDAVLAGPCGSVPVVRRLGAAPVIMLEEIVDHLVAKHPELRASFEWLAAGLEHV